MDMSRDEINGRVDNRGGRGSRHRRRSGGIGPIRHHDGRERSRRPVPYSRIPDIAHQRDHGGPIEGTKVFLSNLDSDLCGEDIEEIFGRFGRVREGTVHYDRSGVSLGTGTVTFERRADAMEAIQLADELRRPDQPRTVEIISPAPYSRGTGQNRRSFARRGGTGLRGVGRGRIAPTATRSSTPTAQELDAYSCERENLRRRVVRFSDGLCE